MQYKYITSTRKSKEEMKYFPFFWYSSIESLAGRDVNRKKRAYPKVRSAVTDYRLLPRKNRANVPGPEWEPMTAPT